MSYSSLHLVSSASSDEDLSVWLNSGVIPPPSALGKHLVLKTGKEKKKSAESSSKLFRCLHSFGAILSVFFGHPSDLRKEFSQLCDILRVLVFKALRASAPLTQFSVLARTLLKVKP